MTMPTTTPILRRAPGAALRLETRTILDDARQHYWAGVTATLVTAHQLANTLEAAITNGDVSADLALVAWKRALKTELTKDDGGQG